MSDGNVMGVFVWNELASTDVKAARDFYAKLFGWRIEAQSVGGMDYHMAFAGETPVAGLMQAPPAQQVPSHWLPYVSVDDVDGRTDKAVRLGAEQLVGGMDIPEVGRFSVIRDPQGAVIAPFRGLQDARAPENKKGHGEFVWYELMTSDTEKAKAFYRAIFGWNLVKHPMEGPEYWMFAVGDKPVGGVWKKPDEADFPPHWLMYIGAHDVDAAARDAKAMGGKVLKDPADIPSVGRFAVLADNTGGVFAAFKGQA